jgi:hypothetical protein
MGAFSGKSMTVLASLWVALAACAGAAKRLLTGADIKNGSLSGADMRRSVAGRCGPWWSAPGWSSAKFPFSRRARCATMALMRRHLAWPIALPLAVIGSLAGHSIGYRTALPAAHERDSVLASSGHGWLQHAPLIVGLCSVAVLLAFAAAVIGRERSWSVQLKLVAAIPPLTFVAQEFLERYLHDGSVAWGFLLSMPFVLGFIAQVPFALLAASIAFALGKAAEHLSSALRAAKRPRFAAIAFGRLPAAVDLPLRPVLARGFAGRGPPASLAT